MTDDASRGTLQLEGPLADRSSWRADGCPAAAALAVVGTRSALLLMREAYYGTTRFDDFVERVGITEAVAARRLRELTDHGLFERVPYREPGRRTRQEYRLTEMGLDLAPVVLALYEWGARHVSARGKAPLEFRHAGCGEPVRVEPVCAAGHPVGLDEITVRPAARSTPRHDG